MTQEDQFYRAFGELKKSTEENRLIVSTTNAVVNAAEADKVTVTHNVCHVEEDWVAAIERGLVFIGRAISEDRQFIRSNGEVQPIEKVKHISRESVQHLSKHSDLITREQKEDIIPDKLYTVERLNDYAVYENRFLYVLLLRIQDFVGVRYDAIMRAYRLYRGELKAKKTVSSGARRLQYTLNLTDEQDDIFAAAADKECASYLDRIEKIQQSVAFYLRTPLMIEVSRVDKIKKLTKTNVLRMDKNFREAVTLYEFLLDYDRDGYTIESHVRSLNPVDPDIAREFALTMQLSAFLVYEHGLGIEKYLQEEFEKEEKHREELRQLALVEKIKALKKRIAETGKGVEEYMLALEERNAALEQDSKELVKARAQIQELNQIVLNQRSEIELLNGEIATLNEKVVKLEEEMDTIKETHKKEMEELRAKHREAISALNAAHEEEVTKLKEGFEEAARRADQAHRDEVKRLRTDCETKLTESRIQVEEAQKQLSAAKGELKSVDLEREMLNARLLALRREHGLLTAADDFTTEEGFNALEHEYEVLGKLVREKWTDVKQMLKREFYRGIRTTMKGKRAKKSAEYQELSAEAKERRIRSGEQPPASPANSKPAAPAKTKPAAPKPAAPAQPKPVDSKPAAPAQAKPVEAKPAAPVQPKPVEQKPVAQSQAKPAEPKPAAPVQPKPVEPKPAALAAKPAVQKPAAPAQPKPVEPKPAAPAQPKSVEAKPAAPAQPKSVEPKPAEPKPAAPAQAKPVEPKPAAPAQPKPVEPKPAARPTEKKPTAPQSATPKEEGIKKEGTKSNGIKNG